MKIKEHLQLAFTNPLGNLLAIANLAMIAVSDNHWFWFHPKPRFLVDINLPAIGASMFLMGGISAGTILPPIVYLQWIFIGWLARVISRQYQPELA